MSTGPVARWLDTFVFNSKQYAEIFKKFGFDTLNEVCKLDPVQLSKMGVNQMDSEKIMENVSVLRQTLQISNININTPSPVTTVPTVVTPVTAPAAANQKAPRKTKAKAPKQQAIPNVTINQVNSNGMPVNSMPAMRQTHVGNPDAAKKIGNEILQMANNNQTSTKYTCIPVNNNQNQNYTNYQYNYPTNQQQHQVYQYNNNSSNNNNGMAQSYRPMNQNYNQNYGYYNNNNWNQQQQQQDYYNSNPYYQYQQPQVQQHSNDFYSQSYKQNSNNGTNNNNNSPLEFLERLVQLPESSQVVDPKSIVNSEGQIVDGCFDDMNKNNKRIMNIDNFNTADTKKVCSSASASSSSSNSPNFKIGNQQQQQRYLNISSDSPSSSSSCSSSSSSTTQAPLCLNSQADLVSANLIDTCNFDFLDYLPELNSNTIDQTITSTLNEQIITSSSTTTSSSSSSSSSSSNSSQLDNLLSTEQISQSFQFNNFQ